MPSVNTICTLDMFIIVWIASIVVYSISEDALQHDEAHKSSEYSRYGISKIRIDFEKLRPSEDQSL